MSRQFTYKSIWNFGNSAQLTNSKKVLKRVSKERNGQSFEHNPFALKSEIDHSDEFGQWVKIDILP